MNIKINFKYPVAIPALETKGKKQRLCSIKHNTKLHTTITPAAPQKLANKNSNVYRSSTPFYN